MGAAEWRYLGDENVAAPILTYGNLIRRIVERGIWRRREYQDVT
jgi:hypothetical protein